MNATKPKSEDSRPIVRWPGGKRRLLKRLLPMIPPHVCYVEPFAGGLAMLFAKERSKVEVINDINGDLVALYLNVQRHLPEVLRQIETVFSSRQLFKLYQANPGLTEIERATRFLIRNRTSFGGNTKDFAVAKTAGGGGAFSRQFVMEVLEAAHRRLDKVVVEHVSYEKCFKLYDSKDSYFFCDSPYVNAPTGAYEGFTEADATTYRDHVFALKGQWLVTINDSPFTRDLFKGCRIESVVSKNGITNNARSPKATFGELIITKD